MQRCFSSGGVAAVLLLLSGAAQAQFIGGTAFNPPASSPPAVPVRKAVEDDGASAYSITDLGTLPDTLVAASSPGGTPPAWTHWQPESVGGINTRGDVAVNFTRTAGGKRIGIYSAQTGKFTVLSLPSISPSAECYATGLSDSGQVLGATNSVGSTTGQFHPVLWKDAGGLDIFDEKDDTGRPQQGDMVTANALSPNSLYVAGNIFFNGVGPTLAYWESGTLHHTAPLGQGMFQSGGVNNAGEVVGNAAPPFDEAHSLTTRIAFQWVNGNLQALGPALAGVNCGARAVNAEGDVAGWSDTQDVMIVHRTDVHAVLWKNGQLKDLGTLGGPASTATAISDGGQVIGYSQTGPIGQGETFLWDNGKMQSLTSLIPPGTGWSLGAAQINYGGEGSLVINSRGQIAGIGRRDYQPHAFLLTPRSLIQKK